MSCFRHPREVPMVRVGPTRCQCPQCWCRAVKIQPSLADMAWLRRET